MTGPIVVMFIFFLFQFQLDAETAGASLLMQDRSQEIIWNILAGYVTNHSLINRMHADTRLSIQDRNRGSVTVVKEGLHRKCI